MAQKQIIENGYLRFVNDKSSKYKLEVLSSGNADYKLVEKSIIDTSIEFAKTWYSKENKELRIERICRIHQKFPELKEKSKENILVFHGTPRKNVNGVLKYGFKPSKSLFALNTLCFKRFNI